MDKREPISPVGLGGKGEEGLLLSVTSPGWEYPQSGPYW